MSRISLGFLLLLWSACSPPVSTKEVTLFRNNCSGCHIAPDITELPKNIWAEGILPEMGHRLGIRDTLFDPLEGLSFSEMEAVLKSGVFPENGVINPKDWALLKEYIIRNAPDTLLFPERSDPPENIRLFTPHPVSIDSNNRSTITLLHFDPWSEKLVAGDVSGNLFEWDVLHQAANPLARFPGAVVDYDEKEGGGFVTTIGNLRPSQLAGGVLFNMQGKSVNVVSQNLHRPVHTLVNDLNKDGRDELIISEYGDLTGSLVMFSEDEDRQLNKTILLNQPGTIRTVAEDMDHDGKTDLVVLTAQGDEGITILYQHEDLRFTAKKIIRFSPVYGSSWFELVDYDGDGDKDILTVHGDNADKSAIRKPYHGMRIHINQGNQTFKEEFFYPMPGATRIIARDFDQDGDTDIALLSTFPDYQAQESPFIYLENKNSKDYVFEPYTFDALGTARWFLMEAGDMDGDGDTDLVLSAFSLSFNKAPQNLVKRWEDNDTDILFLMNNLIKNPE